MKKRALSFSMIALLAATACHTPPVPQEIEEAEVQSLSLQRAGVHVYFPGEYQEYAGLTREAKEQLFRTQAKFGWFRNYEETTARYRLLLAKGDALLQKAESFKGKENESGMARIKSLRNRMENIRKIGILIRDGKIARTILAKADILAEEAEKLIVKGEYERAGAILATAEFYVNDSSNFLMTVLDRYNDPVLLAAWNKSAAETIRISRDRDASAIIVNKLEQTLTLYRKGRPVHGYKVSVGRDGLFDKKHAGDYATPEGSYKISRKNDASRFYKALLIDYPNADDTRAFAVNQKNGLIPSGVGIGGIIEIHGGGNDVVTDGCVSMTDQAIDQLYPLVEVGTPVTIIGSIKSLKAILEQENEQ